MVTVADIIALPAFHEVKVLAGAPDALSRPVVNVGIMDATPSDTAYGDYLAGEFIVTNLGFAREDAAAAEQALCLMLERPLAALAVRNVHGLDLGDAIMAASNASGTPLLAYEGEYYEHVIFQAMQLLERDRADSDLGRLIDGLLASASPEGIRQVFYEMLQASGSTVQCAVLRPIGGDEASLYAQIDELSAVTTAIKRDWERVETANVLRYHDCALVAVTYHRPPEAWALEQDSEFMQLLQPHGRFVAGISEEVALGEGDLAVREAFAALEHAWDRCGQGRGPGARKGGACGEGRPEAREGAIVRWAALGAEAFRLAAKSDRLISSTCELYRQTLAKHDDACGDSLLPTACALAESCGDVRAAADALFQHPNTVRYRMRKMKSVLNLGEATDRELMRFLMLMDLA